MLDGMLDGGGANSSYWSGWPLYWLYYYFDKSAKIKVINFSNLWELENWTLHDSLIELRKMYSACSSIRSAIINWEVLVERHHCFLDYQKFTKTEYHKDQLFNIVSFINSHTYLLSKHLVYILSPLIGGTILLWRILVLLLFKSTSKWRDIGWEWWFHLMWYHSLFTLIPVHRAIEIARDNLEKDESLDDRTSMTVNEICKLLEFRLNVTFLSYKGE